MISRASDGMAADDAAPRNRRRCPAEILFLAGGGYRALLGGVGSIAYLASQDWWEANEEETSPRTVKTVVSVSGGTYLNGALIAGRSMDVSEVLRELLDRIATDRARPWATPRRLALNLVSLAAGLACGAAVVVATQIHAYLTVIAALALVPALLTIFRWTFANSTREIARLVTGSRSYAERARPGIHEQTHIICATGLASGRPHFVEWPSTTNDPGLRHKGWGVVHPGRTLDSVGEGFGLDDAVFASTSLPGSARMKAPVHPDSTERELLIDGGASGNFGDAYFTSLERGSSRLSYDALIIDGGRHAGTVGTLSRGLIKLSFVARLMRWNAIGNETTYVNDLLDLEQHRIVRLCQDRYLARNTIRPSILTADESQPRTPAEPVDIRLDQLRDKTSQFGLAGINRATIANAVTTGIVATAQVVSRLNDRGQGKGLSEADIEALIAEIGPELGMADEIEAAWMSTGTTKERFFDEPVLVRAMSHQGDTSQAAPYTAAAYKAAVDRGFYSMQLDLVERDQALFVEHAVLGRPVTLPGRPVKRGEPLRKILEEVIEHARSTGVRAEDLRFNLEFKSVRVVGPLCELLDDSRNGEVDVGPHQILLSAPFHGRCLRTLRERFPEVSTSESLLEGAAVGRPISLRHRKTTAMACQLSAVHRALTTKIPIIPWMIRQARARDKVVHVWTVNDDEFARDLVRAGAQVVISDRSEMADTIEHVVLPRLDTAEITRKRSHT